MNIHSVGPTFPIGLISCLKSISVNGNNASYLITESSPFYNHDRITFNPLVDRKPSAIYHPATEADAAAAILCAAAYNVSVAPRSGGHSFAGYSLGGQDGVLTIDLNLFQQFSLDPNTGIATIGSGMRLGPLYAKLWDAGKYLIPAGSCASVGLGGHALGGGMGIVGRQYGMLAHSVVEMTLIDSFGHHRHVNATSHPDLFWALRGAGGGSFGLVTEFRIQVYKAPAVITTLNAVYPIDLLQKVVDAFGAWGKTATESVTPILLVQQDRVEIKMTYIGRKEQANAVFIGFYRLAGRPWYYYYEEKSWYDTATYWASLEGGTLEKPLSQTTYFVKAHSLVYRKPISGSELNILYKYLQESPSLDTGDGSNSGEQRAIPYAIFELWGGKIDDPPSPSVFDHHRGALYSLQYGYEWTIPDMDIRPGNHHCSECLKQSAAFANEMQAAYSSGPVLESYQNYMDTDLPEALLAYYGTANLPRLKQIKKTVDPSNVFTFPQAIPLP
ncbi:hypothetical protein BGW41_003146 [Actinomortierella wolfii]|nr:hypothetical protein BGW41_003146 [Actinomortierella wolfii]